MAFRRFLAIPYMQRPAPQESSCKSRLGWLCNPMPTSMESTGPISGWIAVALEDAALREGHIWLSGEYFGCPNGGEFPPLGDSPKAIHIPAFWGSGAARATSDQKVLFTKGHPPPSRRATRRARSPSARMRGSPRDGVSENELAVSRISSGFTSTGQGRGPLGRLDRGGPTVFLRRGRRRRLLDLLEERPPVFFQAGKVLVQVCTRQQRPRHCAPPLRPHSRTDMPTHVRRAAALLRHRR